MVIKKIGWPLAMLTFLLLSACSTSNSTSPYEPLPTATIAPAPAAQEAQLFPYIGTLPTNSPYLILKPSQTPVPTRTPIPEVPGVPTFAPGVNPLTGLPVDNPELLNRRPVMVKIANYPVTGRPHAGLSFADIVFEYYIGYGFNRFYAIFYGQDAPQVGPIRSARLVDAQLADLYPGILVYGNADPQVEGVVLDNIAVRGLAMKDLPCPPVCSSGPRSITSEFTDTAAITEYVKQQGLPNDVPSLLGMRFDPAIPETDQFAVEVGVQFWTTDRGEWHYDPISRLYLRWIEEPLGDNRIKMIPLVDRVTNQQLAYANVIILFTTYTERAPTLHEIALDTNTAGKRAIFFRDGTMTEGIWKAPTPNHPLQFFAKDGELMPLKPGNSWIVLVGDASTFKENEPGQWELRFDIP